MIKIKLTKIGANPEGPYASVMDPLTATDTHPNVKTGDEFVGLVRRDNLIPILDDSYGLCVNGRMTSMYTSTIKKVDNLNSFVTANSIYKINLLQRVFNFRYDALYERVTDFEFDKKNHLVDLTPYEKMLSQLDRVVDALIADYATRKAVVVLSTNDELSCLTSVQFLLEREGEFYDLHCLANYRSQHMRLGAPYDIRLMNYLTTIVSDKLTSFLTPYHIRSLNVEFCVGDFHEY